MNQNKVIGKLGEDLSTKYLENIGYEIIERNFSCKQGEIDIIAKDSDEYVFVEVKTRTSLQYGYPAEAVTKTKREHIKRVAKYFLYVNNNEEEFIRIDVIEIFIYGNRYKVNHIKQVV